MAPLFSWSAVIWSALSAMPATVAAPSPRQPYIDPQPGYSKRESTSSGVQHLQLIPARHPQLDTMELAQLTPNSSASLFYSQDGNIHLSNAPLVASLAADLHWSTVILDHSAWVNSVQCTKKSISMQFSNATAYLHAQQQWTGLTEIVFVSSATSCHAQYPGQYGFFNTSAPVFNSRAMSASASGSQISMSQAVAEFKVEWGNYEHQTQSPNLLIAVSTPSTSSHSSTTTKKTSSATSKSTSTSTHSSSHSTAITSSHASSTSTTHKSSTSSATTTHKSSTSSTTTTQESSSPSTAITSTSSPVVAKLPPILAVSATASTSSTSVTGIPRLTFASTSSTHCGSLPTVIPAGLPSLQSAIPCGNTFDQALDEFLGYIQDQSDVDTVLAEFIPDVSGLTAEDFLAANPNYLGPTRRAVEHLATLFGLSLHKRGWFGDVCNWVDDNVIQPVENVVVAVVDTVVAVVQVLSAVAQEAVNLVEEAAQALLPTFHPSISFTLPIDIAAPDAELDDSPWGQAYHIWSYSEDGSDFNYGVNAETLSNLVGANELLTFSINGVDQLPQPGIDLYCVGCSITGSLKTTGSATYTLLLGFTDLSLGFEGDVHATFQLGLNAYAEYDYTVASIRILEAGVPGFYIPEVITVGPMLTLDVDATVDIQALGQVLAGAEYDFNNIGATIDFFDLEKSSGHGFLPQVSTVFNVSGQINATASVGVPIGVGVGIDILDGAYTKEIAVVDRPALELVAIWSGEYSDQNACNPDDTSCTDNSSGNDITEGCAGIYWYVDFINELTLNIGDDDSYDIGSWEGPKFAQGCVGDDGVSTVEQQQSPPSGDTTAAGCELVSDIIVNGGFDTISPDGYVLPWSNSQTSGEQVYVELDPDTTSPQYSMRFYIDSGGDDTQTYTGTAYQTVTACTDSQYDINFVARMVSGDGICSISQVAIFSDVDSRLDTYVNVNQILYPVASGKDFMSPYGPYTFTVPSYDNAASASVNLGISMTCIDSTNFDIRLDDVSVGPTAWDSLKKRQASPLGRFAPRQSRDVLVRSSNVTRRDTALPSPLVLVDSPAATSNAASPSYTANYVAPPLPISTGNSPSITAIHDSPTLTAIDDSPSYSAEPTSLLVGSQPATANPTATASLIGPNTYVFPAFSDMIASATLGVGGSATPSASGAAATGFLSLPDLSGTVQMASAADGNQYLASYPGSAAGTSYYSAGSVIIKDDSERVLHYFPDTMSTYGVSRLRAASVGETPLTAQLVTLVPFDTPGQGTVYAALDTEGNAFYLAWCTAADWIGSKVFLVQNYDTALTTLQSSNVQWVVTGDTVTGCNPLLLTSSATPFS